MTYNDLNHKLLNKSSIKEYINKFALSFNSINEDRLKELEEESRRLKQMYAELSLKSQMQADIIKKL